MGDIFRLEEHGTTWGREVTAGLTTFFSMAYIIIVAPNILSQSGIGWGAVFLAAIIASVVGTLVMSLYANVPFALAPGLGMCSFFVVTVCDQMGFTWQQALSMVFICGIINILITVTNVRRLIIAAIPRSLQYAISGGIGLFVAYIGLVQVGIIAFEGGTPALSSFAEPAVLLFLFGLVLAIVLYVRKVRGAIVIALIVTTLVGIPLGLTDSSDSVSFVEAVGQLPDTFGVIFTSEGLPSLFSDASMIPSAVVAILSFSLVDTFDTIGTFIGTGRRSGLFTEEEMSSTDSAGFRTRLDRALLCDSCATSVGAVFGTSNTTTVVESTAGIEAGGRTGLTSLVVAVCIALSAVLASAISMIPPSAYGAVLVLVGILMLPSFKSVDWDDIADAVPAFFAGLFMALCYNISYGIAMGFIAYCLMNVVTSRRSEVSGVMWVVSGLFILVFALQALIGVMI
ncbi:MAG: guanine permease [Methanomassiliicoccales archaeon Mx-03]|nr:MAG: guanine permease [Methanomassiliicoccales archaeon Mx-03]